MYSLWWLSSDGTTAYVSWRSALLAREGFSTVDINIARLHELAELRQPLGGVDLSHVDGTQGCR